MVSPIFLFSLPRSGSTLLQRMIAAHPEVATASEPWLLLPFLYARKGQGIYAEYNHLAMREALNDFIAVLPRSTDDYREALRSFIIDLYSRAAGSGKTYFLEKTPRYYLIINEIFSLFPDARFIFLWRNPVATISSFIETFGCGRWRLYDYKIDLFDGFESLHKAFVKNKSKICQVCYESLIKNTEEEYSLILDYLNLPFSDNGLSGFQHVELQGGAGDPIGTKKYKKLSNEPIEKWRKIISNPIRKAWTLRYLKWIGKERLAEIDYDYDILRQHVRQLPTTTERLISDSIRIFYGVFKNFLEFQICKDKWKLMPNWHRIHDHK